jgi:uncharacterized protein
MTRALFALLAVPLLAGACGSGGGHSAKEASGTFAYDRGAPLRARDRGVANPGYPIAVHNVSFASPKGGRVTAYLVVPPGKGRRPAVVYLHGGGGNRAELLLPATWMAARGAVSLTVDAPEARRPIRALPGLAGLKQQRELTVQTVVDLRRAVDYLRSRPQVDPDRLAFVGISAGARTGAILAAVDHRYKDFVLMSGGAIPVAGYVKVAPQALRGAIGRDLGAVDPLRYVRAAAPSRVFFQDGLRDQIVPRSALVNLYRAGSRPKQIRWYAAGHTLNDAAYRDQLTWLSRELRLDGPTVKRVTTGP